jgi:hypothetical protein
MDLSSKLPRMMGRREVMRDIFRNPFLSLKGAGFETGNFARQKPPLGFSAEELSRSQQQSKTAALSARLALEATDNCGAVEIWEDRRSLLVGLPAQSVLLYFRHSPQAEKPPEDMPIFVGLGDAPASPRGIRHR